MNDNYELLERFLDSLINPDDCVDTFGRTYLDDLEIIAHENHSYNSITQSFPDTVLQSAFDRVREQFGIKGIPELKEFVYARRGEIAIANYRPRSALNPEGDFATEPSYLALQNNGDSIDGSNEFQKKWSERGLISAFENNTDRDYYEIGRAHV